MNPNIFLTTPGVERMGWMLVHFVWQGVLLALVIAVLLRLLRSAKPQTRYLATLVGMFLMAVVPAITFMMINPRMPAQQQAPRIPPEAIELFNRLAATLSETTEPGSDFVASRKSEPITDTNQPSEGMATARQQEIPVVASTDTSWGVRIELQLERSFPWLVLAWLLGVVALSARQMTAWRLTHRLRRRWVKPVEPHLREALSRLCDRMGVQHAVGLLESAVIEVPSMIGWLKPLILLPASALTGLSPAQIEQVLAHELAHVRRNDYLVNLLQTILETLLFYHPAVWWLGRQMRTLREHCCDDLVIEVLGDAHGYACALTHMEELRMESSEFALALTGGTLMERIRRILGMKERETNGDRWFAGLITVTLVFLAVAWMLATQPNTAMAAGEIEASISKDLKSKPGYVDLKAFTLLKDVEPTVEVMLPKVLLNMTISALKNSEPELAKLVEGLDLDLVHVKVYEELGESADKVVKAVQKQTLDLMKKGWMPVVRVPEENVNILLRAEGEMLQGGLVLVAPDDELVFVNIVGDIDSAKMGEKMGALIGEVIAGNIDFEDLFEGLGEAMEDLQEGVPSPTPAPSHEHGAPTIPGDYGATQARPEEPVVPQSGTGSAHGESGTQSHQHHPGGTGSK